MSVKTLTRTILDKMSDISKWQSDFLIQNFELQCQLRGRHNFLNMSRYGELNESTYRENYGRDFDFKAFNILLAEMFCSPKKAVAFDPSYISKSGKHTPGCGYFWSGCAGHNKWGLEIGGFATIDIVNNTAMHFVANQTLGFEEHGNLLNYYGDLVAYHTEDIKRISKHVVVDAFFSRKPFIDKACNSGLEVITRLRKYAGKLDARNLLYN